MLTMCLQNSFQFEAMELYLFSSYCMKVRIRAVRIRAASVQ
ncbi:hypothetical protein RchiOBHm_Chr2g0167201 [Rosa chinensis]|uniref:Uncharacterized protein n=1 Tax=Rosa chinensis TaxID=74649 RepID=A0A2P6S495_ROSCH|nr:hypothetical protein RchiOBHm_Chr2g0167201 [Rosa chinensis]